MKKIFLATQNKHKFLEISAILALHGIKLYWKNMALLEPDFSSLQEIAGFKAADAFRKLKQPVIVEDTGVFFEAFNSFPGPLAKRVFNGIGFSGLASLIKSAENKNTFFETVICYCPKKGSYRFFSGRLYGRLLEKPRALKKDRLPYEKIFVPNGYYKALAEISKEEKNKISHRGIATLKLAGFLSKNY